MIAEPVMNPLAMSVSIASAVLAMKNNGGGKLSKFHAACLRAKDAPCCFQKETARRYVVDEDTRKGNLLTSQEWEFVPKRLYENVPSSCIEDDAQNLKSDHKNDDNRVELL